MSSGKNSQCEFERPTPNVIATRHRKEIVQELSSGTECEVLLDQIDLYAEFGGKTFDEDVIIGVAKCVHIRGRYVVNIGTFATSTEESVAEGAHRIVAPVGPETFKALKMAELLLNEIDAGTAKMNVPVGQMDKTLPAREAESSKTHLYSPFAFLCIFQYFHSVLDGLADNHGVFLSSKTGLAMCRTESRHVFWFS